MISNNDRGWIPASHGIEVISSAIINHFLYINLQHISKGRPLLACENILILSRTEKRICEMQVFPKHKADSAIDGCLHWNESMGIEF